jgi:2-keto-3-deoxy-L-rhamnonate aldolase RhmA
MQSRGSVWILGTVLLMTGASLANGQTDWDNPVKKTLREGKPAVGLTVSIPSPEVVVQASTLGFDFVWIEMEHSPTTLETLRNMVLATRGTSLVPIVRVPINELWTAKRVLDSGALGVVFPWVSTPDLARQAVAACKYPPLGKRGSGNGLASLRWPAPGGYADWADRNVMVIAIIEEKEAIDNIDQIAAVPGVDVLFIGPTDLSYSYGLRGKQDTPVMKEAIAKVLAAGKKHNVPVGRTVSGAEGPDLIKQGFLFFQAGSELNYMALGTQAVLKGVGKTPPDLSSRPLY